MLLKMSEKEEAIFSTNIYLSSVAIAHLPEIKFFVNSQHSKLHGPS